MTTGRKSIYLTETTTCHRLWEAEPIWLRIHFEEDPCTLPIHCLLISIQMDVHSLKISHCQEYVRQNVSSRTCWGKLEITQEAWEGILKVRETSFYLRSCSCLILFSSLTLIQHDEKWKMDLEPSDRHLTISECDHMSLWAVHDSKIIHILESEKSMGMAQMPHSPAMAWCCEKTLALSCWGHFYNLKGASSKKADQQSKDILSTVMQETLEKNSCKKPPRT